MRGWKNNKTALVNIYNELNPEIILLNDTSIVNQERIKIFNYNIHHSNKANTLHNGTAIAIRKDIQYRLQDDFESDLLGITVTTHQGPITFSTLYNPPAAPYLNLIDMHKLFSREEPVYFLGDLNARHRTFGHTTPNSTGRNIDTLITENKCKHDGPFFPTLLRHNSSTSPDIILSNYKTFHNTYSYPGPMTPSDHISIVFTVSSDPIQIPIKPRQSIHKANWQQYQNDLSGLQPPTEHYPLLTDIDNHLDTWTKAVIKASEDNIPTLRYRTVPGIKPNDTIRTIQQEYDSLIWIRESMGTNLEINRQINELKHRLSEEYKRLQNECWNNLIDRLDIQEDPTAFWQSIKKLQGTNKTLTPYIKDHNNKKIDNPKDKEILFRNHWQKIFTDEDGPDDNFDQDAIQQTENAINERLDLKPYNHSNLLRLDDRCPKITLTELKNTISEFKQKAPGPTKLTIAHIKHLPENMLNYLLYIFNHSLAAGYFPKSLKIANMIFIPKGNESQYQVINYRPISLIDIHSKILDKILNKRLSKFLEQNSIHNIRQHGFRKTRGTHTALATLNETLASAKAHRQCTDIVLRDVSKAFDKVWHVGLTFKIVNLALHTCFTRILINYLHDRTATITIDNHTGPAFSLRSGVPQGACLSPTLYTLYTHDLPEPLPNTEYIAFADDITQITSGRYKHKDAARNTEHAIRQINTFERKWKIKTNIKKFKIIPISRRKTTYPVIDDNIFHYTNSGKILGLNITSNGLANQVKIRKAIAAKNLTKIYRFRNLNPKNKTKLYKSLVLSALIYPVIPLNTIAKSSMLSLQRIQNQALRFITNTHWTDFRTSESLHRQCNMLPVNITIHNNARNLWKGMKDNQTRLYNDLKRLIPDNTVQHTRFLSSRIIAEGPAPGPLYS